MADIKAPVDLAPLRAALDMDARATPGEWWQGTHEKHHVFGDRGNPDLFSPVAGRVITRMNHHYPSFAADAAAIAALHNAAPGLRAALDELAVLRAGVAGLRAAVAAPDNVSEVLGAAWYVLNIVDGLVNCTTLMRLADEMSTVDATCALDTHQEPRPLDPRATERLRAMVGALPKVSHEEIAQHLGLGVDEEVGRG